MDDFAFHKNQFVITLILINSNLDVSVGDAVMF